VTYYYDNPGNVKLLTILECAIRGLGLLMVYLQTSSPSLGSTAAALMVTLTPFYFKCFKAKEDALSCKAEHY
jgi:hypothetical protein